MLDGLGRRLRAYAEKDGRGYPDWAVRYVPIVRRLRPRLASSQRILEIGANENGLGRFAAVRVVAVDTSVEHLKAARTGLDTIAVVGDIRALPFRDGSFDVCVCVDTFEHLPENARDGAAGEMARVLHDSGTALVAFPSGAASTRAEASIIEAYRRFTGNTLHWLDEHAALGLPEPERIIRRFEVLMNGTHRVWQTKNATLWLWRWMWLVLMCGWPGRGNSLFQALLRAMTPVLCRIHVGQCYRFMIWVEPKKNE